MLFLDALQIQIKELGKRWLVPALVLGPGTALIIALGAMPLAWMLGFTWTVAFIGGAVLASTDPVILREILQDERIPRPVRQVLKIEAGTNDLVVLPVILILIAVAQSEIGAPLGWAGFLFKLLILGPAVGFIIGGIGSWLMAKSNERLGVKRVHQALFGLGLVLASYSAATALGGDGFLAAFFAGLAVVLLNQTLCSCFLDYGETSAEMAMMVAFILFGAVLSGILGAIGYLARFAPGCARDLPHQAIRTWRGLYGPEEMGSPLPGGMVRPQGAQLAPARPSGCAG